MDFDNNELAKSLVDLIDETLDEIEELKKSSKFSASEIKIEGPGKDGVASHPTDGNIEAKKAEDKDEKGEDDNDADDKDKKDMDNKKDMEKADVEKACADVAKMDDVSKAEMYKMYMDNKMKKGVNEQADPGAVHKADEVAKGVNEQADPGAVHKSEKPSQDEELMKSYIDGKISSLEGKFAEVSELIKKLGEQPVERKSVAAGAQVDPLKKSVDEVEPLSKSEIASKMFELKKSGTPVDTADIVQVETGSLTDARNLAAKYNIK